MKISSAEREQNPVGSGAVKSKDIVMSIEHSNLFREGQHLRIGDQEAVLS